ncbi:hypothetical protein ACFWMQ_15845 [Streptomyces sp. NPDC058372]|uniref:hypothetical protein n=1 Tax=Streptomyces sp. NPDC058372 TaxID=3346464 RepID=UPI0036462844
MSTQPTMTGPEAYAKAVEYARRAARLADDDTERNRDRAQTAAAVSRAFAAIAQAEATARGTARDGYYPGGGWGEITHPTRF